MEVLPVLCPQTPGTTIAVTAKTNDSAKVLENAVRLWETVSVCLALLISHSTRFYSPFCLKLAFKVN